RSRSSRGERIHGDVEPAELLGERPREREHGAAGSRRHAEPLLAHARRVADDADDAPALLGRELRRRGVADVEDSVETDVDLTPPLLGSRPEKELRRDEAGVFGYHVAPPGRA